MLRDYKGNVSEKYDQSWKMNVGDAEKSKSISKCSRNILIHCFIFPVG